jgi:hypothetical protein
VDLVELIKQEHGKTSTLFDKLAETSEGAVKTRERLFNDLKTGLEVHTKIVQDIVYPVLRRQEGARDLIPDLKERNELKRQLAELERTPKEDEAFLPKVKELKKLVEQHLRTEERQIFPAIKKAIGAEEAEELARRIAAETRQELQEARQENGGTRNGGSADDASASRNEHMVRVVSRSAQRVGEESAETAERALEASAAGMRGIADNASRQMQQVFQSVQGLTEIYTPTERATEGLRTLMAVPTVAANALQEVQRAWADLLSNGIQRNARVTQELFRCKNTHDVAAVHRQFVEDAVSSWLEGNRRILQATRQATEEALRPIEEEVKRAQQQGRMRRKEAA